MGYVSWFYVQSEVFELSVPEGGLVLHWVERRHGLSHVLMVGKFSIAWLKIIDREIGSFARGHKIRQFI
jgi:hypothetical protein